MTMDKILDLMQWAGSFDAAGRPWLLLGKGPSYSYLPQVPLDEFRVCTLNHVIREVPADIAHVIDIDVVVDCAEAIERQAGVLVMPYHPHEKHRPSARTLVDYAAQIPVLARLAGQGRLIGYNLSTTTRRHGDSPVIDVRFFSAEAALNMLTTIGARTVRSLGVDGGSQYSAAFSDLDDTTRLANGHASFDGQFRTIAATILRSGVDYAPWHVQSPVRVFVGSDHAQVAGVKVLEYSIKKFASMSVQVEKIDDTGVPVPQKVEHRSRTGFSFSRFRIPELCGHRGRGIYVDADMQVFTDITDLWTRDFDGNHLLYAEQDSESGRIPQYSVMLLDCEALQWDVGRIVAGLDAGEYDYAGLMQRMCIVPSDKQAPLLPEAWNSLERYEPGETRLIHYTDMPTQPWVSPDNPNGHIWYECAREAVETGFLSRDFLYGEVAAGHVSPDLPGWLGLPDPEDHARLRRDWVPPFRRFAGMPLTGGEPRRPGRSRPATAGAQAPGPAAAAALPRSQSGPLHRAVRSFARHAPPGLVNVLRRARGRVRGY